MSHDAKTEESVCVIGAGLSGLIATKICLEEGLSPVCYERGNNYGGVWDYQEDTEEEQNRVMYTTVTNTSKEFMAFSDFPPPKHFPNYMHHTKVLEYIQMYVEKFDLEQYIRYNTTVHNIRPNEYSYSSARLQWEVTLVTKDDKVIVEMFDAVMICNGHCSIPNEPTFPGEDSFTGHMIHSKRYRKADRKYEGKTVVVIGMGNSGGDIAVDLSYVAKQVHGSMRRGNWLVSRLCEAGIPPDISILSRFTMWLLSKMPTCYVNWYFWRLCNKVANHKFLGIQPTHRFTQQYALSNDDLASRILNGTVRIQCDVAKIDGNTVHFTDGKVVEGVDIIIKATGYQHSIPFLPSSILSTAQHQQLPIYGLMWPLTSVDSREASSTLAIIGHVKPLGPYTPVVEMQSRWAAAVFKNRVKLPPIQERLREIEEARKTREAQFLDSDRHNNVVPLIGYMDFMANHVGCKPDLFGLMFMDPLLALRCIFGPCTPAQYRLQGPGRWTGARDTIITTWDRVKYPLRTAFNS